MAKIIEAKAIISGEEKLSPLLDKLSKKFDQVQKSAKASEKVDQMAKSVERLRTQAAAIDKLKLDMPGLSAARQQFVAAEQAVQKAARAMREGAGPAKELRTAYDQAVRAVQSASRAYERQQQVVLASKRALEGSGMAIRTVADAQRQLASSVDRANAALAHQERTMERGARRAARMRELGTIGSVAGMYAAHGATEAARASLHTYREFDKERRFGKVVMGLTDEQQRPLVNQAIHMGATTKYNDLQVLEAQRELAARGLNAAQVQGLISPAANLGQSLDLTLPEAVRQLEGSMFGFKRDISSTEAATASATRTADLQVKAAKVSGMKPEDLVQLYKYGATPARMAGMSEETLLSFGGILKKANMGGDEAGVAFRALMAATQSPTQKAREAMLAHGMNYKNYQKFADHLDVKPFVENVAAQYGVKLDRSAQTGLDMIFRNKDLVGDPAKFTPAVMQFLQGSLHGRDAKSLKSIAGMANRYRSSSVEGIDADRFVTDLMSHLANNLQFSNAIFGSKQGGRIATALGDPTTFMHMLDEIKNHSGGYAETISAERMAGFDGAVSRFEGAVKNLETAIGRAFDKDGKGGALTAVTDFAGKMIQKAAELPAATLAVGTSIAAGVSGLAGLTGMVNLGNLITGGRLAGGAAALNSAWAGVPVLTAGAGLVLGGMQLHEAAVENEGKSIGERRGRMSDVYRRAFNADRSAMGLPLIGNGDGSGYYDGGAAFGPPAGASGPVTAELHGSAEVKGEAVVTIRIPGLPDNFARVPLKGNLNANGPGSLGVSSPDAAAPRPSGVGHN